MHNLRTKPSFLGKLSISRLFLIVPLLLFLSIFVWQGSWQTQTVLAQSSDPVDAASQDAPEIIGGREAQPGAYPFMAALVLADYENAYVGQYCGASLIAPDWVMTAAHCVERATPDDFNIVIGRHRLSTSEGRRISLTQILIHPGYDVDGFLSGSDVALLRLETPVTDVTPVAIDASGSISVEARAIAGMMIGWGVAGSSSFYGTDELREVMLPFVDHAVCNEYGANDGLVSSDMLCAGHYSAGKSACYGDSGGPLMIPTSEAPGWKVVGIASWGPSGCNSINRYGVYTRIASFETWVRGCSTDPNAKDCMGGDDFEPDNTLQAAHGLSATGEVQIHTFHDKDDVDWLKFEAEAGKTYVISVNAVEVTDTVKNVVDPILWLFDSDGVTALAYNDDATQGDPYYDDRQPNSLLIWTAPRAGTFYLQVESRWSRTHADDEYAANIFVATNSFYLPLAQRNSYLQPAVEVAFPEILPTPPPALVTATPALPPPTATPAPPTTTPTA